MIRQQQCMLICIFAQCHDRGMEPLQLPEGAGISDEHLNTDAPYVRAIVIQRLEQAWRACEPHLVVQHNPETGLVMRPDVRFVEAGIRIVDRLASIYRLHAPGKSSDGEREDREAVAARVLASIEDMETKMARNTG